MQAFCALAAIVFVVIFGAAVLATGLGLIPDVVGVLVSAMCAVGVWNVTAMI